VTERCGHLSFFCYNYERKLPAPHYFVGNILIAVFFSSPSTVKPERGLLAFTVAVAMHYDDNYLTDHHEDIRINQNSLSPLSECNCTVTGDTVKKSGVYI